jgi:hypothetical protein
MVLIWGGGRSRKRCIAELCDWSCGSVASIRKYKILLFRLRAKQFLHDVSLQSPISQGRAPLSPITAFFKLGWAIGGEGIGRCMV